MTDFLFITIATLIAGVGGTGLGGFIGALFRKESRRLTSLLLSFAAGVMLAIVCLDLLIDAIESSQEISDLGVLFVIVGVVAGVAVVYGLNLLIDKKTAHEGFHAADEDHPETHDDLDELIHADHLAEHRERNDSPTTLFVAGLIMAAAIALHNLPEGIIIGAGFAAQTDIAAATGAGMVLAFLIGLHNVPEGMAVSVPLINGGMKRVRAVLITALMGLPTVFGAWIGFLVGDIGPVGLMISLSFASGAMLYVVFAEIIPQSVLMYRSKLPAFFVIIGILLGLLIIYI